MYWKKRLYTKEIPGHKIKKTISRIKAGKGIPHIYVIAIAPDSAGLLEIIPSFVLCQKYYPKNQLKIIGLARHKRNACFLVCHLIGKIFEETNTVNVKEYFADAVFSA